MKTYADALLALGGRNRRKLGNNTYLERLGYNEIGILLHGTYVVRFYSNGLCELNSGGWRTNVTKDRINAYSPASVSQKNFEWFIGTTPFHDGIKVDAQGQPKR